MYLGVPPSSKQLHFSSMMPCGCWDEETSRFCSVNYDFMTWIQEINS